MGLHPSKIRHVVRVKLYRLLFYRHALGDSKVRKTMGYDEFRMLHYAGDVTYNVTGYYLSVKLKNIPVMNYPANFTVLTAKKIAT